jgi:CheY-like chemotaxis protein
MTRDPHVLIVDDDADVQDLLAELLSRNGYTVDIATNGAEAINVLSSGAPPCAVLVDLMMPGIVGQELLEYIRSDEKLAEVEIAIISGSPELAPEGYATFAKPVSSGTVLDFLRNRCERPQH